MSEIPPPQNQPPFQQQPGFSNYPRATYSANPYQRPPGIYFDSINLAWNLVKSDFGTWVPTILIFGIVMYAITLPLNFGMTYLIYGNVFGPPTPSITSFATSLLIGLIPGFFVNVLSAGVLMMGLKVARGEPIGIGDMFGGFRRMGSIMIATFITTILTYIGIVLLIVPGLFVVGSMAFVPLLILDRNLSIADAITTSFNALKQHALAMFGLIFVAGFLSVLGACLCGFGALFTAPIYMVVLGLTYNNFFPPAGMAPGYGQAIGVEPPR